MKKPLLLMILDGFGIGGHTGNAIEAAATPNLDRLFAENPTTQIGASGLNVGLPDGQMGNSEVGHTNIGAGRIVYQELTRITKAIEEGSFFENEALDQAMEQVAANSSSLHLMGLLSDGGVHSHNSHLYALIEMAKRKGIKRRISMRSWTAEMCRPALAKDMLPIARKNWRKSASAALQPSWDATMPWIVTTVGSG